MQCFMADDAKDTLNAKFCAVKILLAFVGSKYRLNAKGKMEKGIFDCWKFPQLLSSFVSLNLKIHTKASGKSQPCQVPC